MGRQLLLALLQTTESSSEVSWLYGEAVPRGNVCKHSPIHSQTFVEHQLRVRPCMLNGSMGVLSPSSRGENSILGGWEKYLALTRFCGPPKLKPTRQYLIP